MTSSMLKLLDAADTAHREEWLRRWSAWPEREPMAHPAYARLFARDRDRAICAVAGSEESGILYPLILRPLATEAWAPTDEQAWDATTPYGYGGAFAWGEAVPAAPDFWVALEEKLRSMRVVTSFARLSLFEHQILPFSGETVANMPNVVRQLDMPLEVIWADYAAKVRKNVRTARNAGLQVEFDFDGRRLEEFHRVYVGTMDRREASEGYYFPLSFFETIVREMPTSFVFAHVLKDAAVVSTELILKSRNHLYSFLGGTAAEAFNLRPNDLLKHAAIEWGSEHKMTQYVLGGGYGGADGIFRYKLAFAPSGEIPFRVGRAIHDPELHDRLVKARAAFERSRGQEWVPRPGFFPEYRA